MRVRQVPHPFISVACAAYPETPMAEIKISCVQCGQHIQLDESYGGRQIGCPACQTAFVVPHVMQAKPTLHVASPREKTYLVNSNGKQRGPYTIEDLKPLLESGELAWEDLAWCEGMSNWQPLRGIIVPAGLASAPPPLPSARRATLRTQNSGKAKPRATWWVVSTHVLTACVSFPFLIGLLYGFSIVFFKMNLGEGEQIILGFGVGLIGITGGTYYSLSYLRKTAQHPDWRKCTIPSIVTAAVLSALTIGVQTYLNPPFFVTYLVGSLTCLVVFSVVTAKAFREASPQPL